MPEIKDAGHRRRHSLAGSFSQIPFVLYFTPRPQLSKGMIVRGTGRSKSYSKDGKPRPSSSISSSSSGSSSDLSWHMVSLCDEGGSQAMIAPLVDSVQAGGRRNGHSPGFHGNNVLKKKKRRTSQTSCLESGSLSLQMPTSLESMPNSRPRFAHPSSYTATQTRSQVSSQPPVAMTQSISSTTSISTRSLALKQNSLWLNRKATPPSPSNTKLFPTPPPPPKILEKTSSSSSTLAASFEDSVSSSSTTTLTRFPSHFTSSSFQTSVEDRGRPTNRVPSISTSSSFNSSSSSSSGNGVHSYHTQHQPIHLNHKRSASIATSMSMYSQMSYPRHLKLPWDPIDGDSESGDVEEWLVVKDQDVHSMLGISFCLDGGQEAKELVGSSSGKKSMRGKTRLGRRNSRIRQQAHSRHHLSQSNSRCTSPSPYLEVPTPPHADRHCRPRKEPQRHRRKRSTDTSFTNSTFATLSSVATASTATSTWRREIAEVKEDMKSFLDMSASVGLEGVEGNGEEKRESVWFEVEVPSDSEGCMTPGGTESLRMKWKVKKSCSNMKATSSRDGTSPPPSFLQVQSLSDRYSRVLPSPSPVPTLSYVVFEDEEEERRARYPLPLSRPAISSSNSTSTSTNTQSSQASPITPDSSSHSDQHDLDTLQLDYDYNFAVDVLVHIPESLVDPSFRGPKHSNVTRGERTRKASFSANLRLKLGPEDVDALVHGGTKAAFVDERHSGAKKVGKRPKLSRAKWSFGGSQGSKAGPGSKRDGVEHSVQLSLDRKTDGEDYRRKEKKSLVVQVTNFFSRV